MIVRIEIDLQAKGRIDYYRMKEIMEAMKEAAKKLTKDYYEIQEVFGLRIMGTEYDTEE